MALIRRRKIKRMGFRELRGAVMHKRSGFAFAASNSRAVLRRAPTRNVSQEGMKGLRWYNITGAKRRALQRKLLRDMRQPRVLQIFRRQMPLKMRKPGTLQLY